MMLCPIHNRRYQERVTDGWCVTCDHCEEGFHDGETVRAARIYRAYSTETVYLHERCWGAWCDERAASSVAGRALLRRHNGAAS